MAVSVSVAVIGAGLSGLAAAAAALEAGLRPTVFERDAEPGGIWRPGTGATWQGMRTNLSRFTCCLTTSDWDASIGDFPLSREVFDYLLAFSRQLGAAVDLRLECEVSQVARAGRRWRVRWRDVRQGQVHAETFDTVIVASGFFSRPVVPAVRNRGRFGGRALHSGAYRSAQGVGGKRVVVVGAAFSGAEIAVDVAQGGAEVTVVCSRPMWILPRLVSGADGRPVPLDLVVYRHRADTVAPADGAGEPTAVEQAIRDDNRRRHQFLSSIAVNPGDLNPDLRLTPDSTDPPYAVVSDGLPQQVRAGAITLTSGRVIGLESCGVLLQDGSRIAADAIIWCTGYRLDLPFLAPSLKRKLGYVSHDLLQPLLLYRGTFHPELPGLAFVGLYRGPYFGVIELQARWACAVFAGHRSFPGHAAARSGLAAELLIRQASPRPQFPHADYPGLADSLAAELGVLAPGGPGSHRYAWWWEAPVIPAHYRMYGPGADPVKAAATIAAVDRRLRGDGDA